MTDFPMDAVIFNKIIEVFNQTRRYVLLLFPLAFFIRIALGFILLKGDDFTDILKDSLFLFLGLFFFTDIFRLTLQIPYFVSSELSFGEWRHINFGEGFFTKVFKRIVDWIGILSYWVSFGLYIVIISILGFFAGYILFLGTMFRAYGMLKVFFLLLFIVSLWPLLWHSINFAVYTIAVSDNALANNVIVGGASLAKVFLPLWIFSKTSKIPLSKSLNKISYFGGSLAGAGAGAYTLLRDKTENVFPQEGLSDKDDKEAESLGAEVNITQTERSITSPPLIEGFPSPENFSAEPEDFSLREGEPLGIENDIFPSEMDSGKTIPQKTETSHHEKSHISQENIRENFRETQNQVTKEIRENSSSQTIKTIDQGEASNPKDYQTHENAPDETKHPVSDQSLEGSTSEKKSIQFNESIHRENWVEEEEYIAPQDQLNKEGENEL